MRKGTAAVEEIIKLDMPNQTKKPDVEVVQSAGDEQSANETGVQEPKLDTSGTCTQEDDKSETYPAKFADTQTEEEDQTADDKEMPSGDGADTRLGIDITGSVAIILDANEANNSNLGGEAGAKETGISAADSRDSTTNQETADHSAEAVDGSVGEATSTEDENAGMMTDKEVGQTKDSLSDMQCNVTPTAVMDADEEAGAGTDNVQPDNFSGEGAPQAPEDNKPEASATEANLLDFDN
jgi:hypothetical protein